jgi:hypothetical protein
MSEEIDSMPYDELIEKFYSLDRKYNQTKKDNEELLQENHSLKCKNIF